MSDWQISRRKFLRGAVGTATAFLGLPLLDVMTPKSLRAASKSIETPIRMGCVYMPNGIPTDAWKPETFNSKIIKMNPYMKSFDGLKNDVQFISGLGSETKGSHPGAAATWLVRPCVEGDRISHVKQSGGASMDQIIASKLLKKNQHIYF